MAATRPRTATTLARALVIGNPVAGGGRAKRAAPLVVDYLRKQGFPVDYTQSASAEDVRRRAQAAAAAGYDCVVALGGDGTFHQVLQGTFGRDVALGFVPAGNGNDIARGLGIPGDPIAAARTLLRSLPRPVDVLRARFAKGTAQLYAGAGGMGLDAEAARLVNGRFRRLPGATRYIAAALRALIRFRPMHVEAVLDGHAWSGPALFVAVANAPQYGAGVKIAPGAKMDDGWLDVTLVRELPWTRFLEAVPPMLRTGDLRWPEIERRRARRISLRAEPPALFHGDGEVLGEAPVEIEVIAGAIRVICPAGGSEAQAG